MRKVLMLLALAATLFGLLIPGVGAAGAATRPVGHLDQTTRTSLSTLALRGWAADPVAINRSTSVDVYVDAHGYRFAATQARPDVARHLKTSYDRFGFDIRVPIPGGPHRVCVYADSLTGSGNPLLGCQTVRRPIDPAGHVDAVTDYCGAPAGQQVVLLVGWAFDPDANGGPGRIAIYVDATDGPDQNTSGQSEAHEPRTDVGRAFGLTDNRVGFANLVAAKRGTFNQIRVYSLNTKGTGTNRLIATIHQSDITYTC